jgi:hypothetical protein
MGSYVSINNNTPDTWLCRLKDGNMFDIPLPTVMSAQAIYKSLQKQGYVTINPGESHKWGKMQLSKWTTAECKKVMPIDDMITHTQTVYGRWVLSGPTDGSTNYYDIQKWLDKGSANKTHFYDPNSP